MTFVEKALLDWGDAREIARIPSMDRNGASAVLWGDGDRFAVLWAPEGTTLARSVNLRGKPPRMTAYQKTLARFRDAGEAIVACHAAESEPVSIEQLVDLVQAKHVSWEPFENWKYVGYGSDRGNDKDCFFRKLDVVPAEAGHTAKVYRALKAHLSPEDWRRMLPLFPSDAEARLRNGTIFQRVGCPAILLTLLLVVLWAAYSLSAYVVNLSR